MIRPAFKNVLVLSGAVVLAGLGLHNIVLKTTWTLMDDGVFWADAAHGVVADRVAASGPGARAGIEPGDVLLAVDDTEVLSGATMQRYLAERPTGEQVRYTLLRAQSKQTLEVSLSPLPQGNVTLFYYLSLIGFFSLSVGTIVLWRRPPDRAALHFYAICVLFFLMYSTSFTGKLDLADWTLLWTDQLAALFLPVVFLHFCLTFPERRLNSRSAWLIPASYLPALIITGAAAASHVLFVATSGQDLLWQITDLVDRLKPAYFGVVFTLSFAVLLDAYRKTQNLTARRQMKWLVWGTGAGILPFLLFYALPFALGREPRLAMELAGYIPLALIPLSLAYAVVKHRLMDVELIFRRTIVSILATAAVVGICLLILGLFGAILSDGEPHRTLIAILSTVIVVLLFAPVKTSIQTLMDRLFYRDRYSARRALLRVSQELNADLDLHRATERLEEEISRALAVTSSAVFLREGDRGFGVLTSRGCSESLQGIRFPADAELVQRLSLGQPVNVDTDVFEEPGPQDLTYYFPCRVRGDLIAFLGVGRKHGIEPLNSEEVDLLQALAGQAATALVNGRLYQSLREKAEALERLTKYNENIIESMDSGIIVTDLEGCVSRWNRAMESLYGQRRGEVLARPLDEVLPAAFLEALRNSLVIDDRSEIVHIYKLHLPAASGRMLRVNVSVAPFHVESGERHGSILIFDDVTARIQLEEQLQHSEKMASIGLLAAGVAHEVNTPLAGISSYTQMLREQVSPGDPRALLLDKIEKQSFRAAKIVNNLLNFSRSAGTEFERLDLNRTLLDVLSLIEHQFDKAHIRVRKEITGELPPVRGNENQLQQVLFNLIINARDAMPSGGWLTLATYSENGSVLIDVRDTGVGIKHEDIKRIYDPFFTTKGLGCGTGLGLSVSYGIVQEHGGTIIVESTPGQGSCFRVALPAYELAEAAQR